MNNIPHNLHYTANHLWLRCENDDTVTVGITAYAQKLLGDVVFVELPDAGAAFAAGESLCSIESVMKSAAAVSLPFACTVTAPNLELAVAPELVSNDCYGDGWLLRVCNGGADFSDGVLNAEQYAELVGEQA